MKHHANRTHKPPIQKKKKTKKETPANPTPADNSLLSNRHMSTDHIMHLQRTLGNRATRRILQDREEEGLSPMQQSGNMQIGKANDAHEQQANFIANQVVQTFDSPNQIASGAEPSVMRADMGNDSLGGTTVSPNIESRIEQARGGGQTLDGSTRKHMEGAFGTDFSNVRIHTGKEADALSRSVQAKAFTTGSDIFFRDGAYNPDQKAGQHLLAHELTHTIQQKQSKELNRMMIQRVMETSGGSWDDKEFKDVMVDGMKPGALMEMHFTPNKLVESKKIALTQKVKKMVNGKNLDLDKKEKEKKGTLFGNAAKTAANRTTDTGEGHWDRMLSATNPVYGAKNLEEGQDISKTEKSTFNMSEELDPKDRSNYQLGHRYNSWFGMKNNVREAILWDQPNVPTGADGTEMIFEVSAVSIKGPQKGTFYGSVEWGFRITGTEDDPQVNLVGPSVVSQGTPSDSMMELAEIWNNKPTVVGGKDVENTKMLTSSYKSLANDIDLTDPTAVQKAIDILEAHMPNIKGTDLKNAKFELKFLKNKLKNLQD